MRLLHTSDWHLGRRLYGRERKAEFQAFLEWLLQQMEREAVECLIVAGDIYDSATPPLWAQSLYFNFLWKLRDTACRYVVIVAGNHDSPALLDGPRALLECLNVHVRAIPSEDPWEEILALKGMEGELELIVCAVPFLRIRDLCSVQWDEEPAEQQKRALESLKARYRRIVEGALQLRQGKSVPIVATGHLFAAGGMADSDVRDLSVGSLDSVPLSVFPPEINYLALGHLHRPQKVGGIEHWRYSGSPVAMGFGEAGQGKQVLIVDFDGTLPEIRSLEVPCFRRLVRLTGTSEQLERDLENLKGRGEPVWAELCCSDNFDRELWERFNQAAKGTEVEILRIRGSREEILGLEENDGLTEDWSTEKIFETLLKDREIASPEADELMALYRQVLERLEQEEPS